jgi:hypothetical protein
MADDECREFVLAYVRRFWRSKVNPQAWITALLKIPPKQRTCCVLLLLYPVGFLPRGVGVHPPLCVVPCEFWC